MNLCRASSFFFSLLCLALFQGCSGSASSPLPNSLFAPSLEHREITAGQFKLTVFSRIQDANQPINVYIDGGIGGFVPAGPPGITSKPDENLTLRLAMLDPSDNVVFISRPCQFGISDPACLDSAWENGRMAKLIYASIRRALDHVLAVVPHTRLNLVGYSGGGAIAALLAADRRDVVSLRTLAGNLDPDGNGQLHGVEPQNDFIDSMQIAPRIAFLPQEHFVGDMDVFIPEKIAKNFLKTMGSSLCAKITTVQGATHRSGWENAWKIHVKRIPSCDTVSLTGN